MSDVLLLIFVNATERLTGWISLIAECLLHRTAIMPIIWAYSKPQQFYQGRVWQIARAIALCIKCGPDTRRGRGSIRSKNKSRHQHNCCSRLHCSQLASVTLTFPPLKIHLLQCSLSSKCFDHLSIYKHSVLKKTQSK